MPSGRTSMPELPANVLLATHPACSERRHRQPSRRSHERKLGDQTKDDADKEPREERSCGRSNVVVQCHAHASLLGEGCAVLARRRTGWADSLPPNSRRAAPPICPDLIVDRHTGPKPISRPSSVRRCGIMTDLDVQDPAAKADNMVNPAFLAASMIEERAPDIVEALNDMPPELAVAVLLRLPPDRAIEVLDQPGLEREPELVTLMPREAAAKLLAGVSADRLADIFHQVKEPHCSELLELLDADTRINIRRLLEYPKDTAGSIMTTEFASVPSTYTVGQTLDYIRHVESSRETVYAIYVLDPLSKKLVKTITLRRLITGDLEAP